MRDGLAEFIKAYNMTGNKKQLKFISLITVFILVFSLSACGLPENYQYSPAVVKGIWKCGERDIVLNFDTQFGEIDNGFNHLIVKQTFQVNTNKLRIYYAENLPEEGFAFDKEKTYIFECTFHEGYFSAIPYENYDIFTKDEKLTFKYTKSNNIIN